MYNQRAPNSEEGAHGSARHLGLWAGSCAAGVWSLSMSSGRIKCMVEIMHSILFVCSSDPLNRAAEKLLWAACVSSPSSWAWASSSSSSSSSSSASPPPLASAPASALASSPVAVPPHLAQHRHHVFGLSVVAGHVDCQNDCCPQCRRLAWSSQHLGIDLTRQQHVSPENVVLWIVHTCASTNVQALTVGKSASISYVTTQPCPESVASAVAVFQNLLSMNQLLNASWNHSCADYLTHYGLWHEMELVSAAWMLPLAQQQAH